MSKILDKINKLILHAKSAELVGHKAEAAAFRKTIRRLSRKHGVKIADVRAYAEKHSPIETEIVQAPPCDLEYWQVVFLASRRHSKGVAVWSSTMVDCRLSDVGNSDERQSRYIANL
jgi:hypothetical protein